MREREDDRSGLGLGAEHVHLPIGAVVMFAGDLTAGNLEQRLIRQGWLPCDGRTVTIKAYRALHQAIGQLYTPSSTDKGSFCVPNYSGQFVRGVATQKTDDPGLDNRTPPPGGGDKTTVGSTQLDMVQTHQHHYQALKGAAPSDAGTDGAIPPPNPTTTTDLLDAGGNALSGEETRPKNIYVHFLIKAAHATRGVGVIW